MDRERTLYLTLEQKEFKKIKNKESPTKPLLHRLQGILTSGFDKPEVFLKVEGFKLWFIWLL